MSRIDEMIYHLEAMQKQMEHGFGVIGSRIQEVEGKERACCIMCGHCPEAEAEWLRAIKQDFQAEAPQTKRKPAPTTAPSPNTEQVEKK